MDPNHCANTLLIIVGLSWIESTTKVGKGKLIKISPTMGEVRVKTYKKIAEKEELHVESMRSLNRGQRS
jgi:hypothetical protein